MAPAASLFTLILAGLPAVLAASSGHAAVTCRAISSAISHSSAVFWPGSAEYVKANKHWSNSSSEVSACAVEPGTPQDLATIVKILGTTRTQFGVKSGGHINNPHFSSTTGVQIYLTRFNKVDYDKKTSTARVGAGLIWDDVYAALEPHGVVAPGGRLAGIGVGGFTLGGGLNWKSNEHGLTSDLVVAFDLILPNGTFVVVTEKSHPDLFFGMKGTYNNFGIVSTFTFKALPQGLVYGGFVIYGPDQLDAVTKATAKFSEQNKDTKASLITTYNYEQGAPNVNLLVFYDGPDPHGIYDDFLAIPSISKDLKTRTFLSSVQSPGIASVGNARSAFHTVSLLDWSENIINVIVNETTFWGEKLSNSASGVFFSYGVDPFFGASDHATPSAYPHDTPLMPLNLFFGWTKASEDHIFTDALKASMKTIYEAAVAEGQDLRFEDGKQFLYPNYALGDVTLEQMYGKKNVKTLKQMRARYDPKNVMSLTGGYRI